MIETKVRVSILLPGSTMLSIEESKANPKESYDRNTIVVDIPKKKGKPSRETIEFYTRKSKNAVQAINVSKESYEYMVSADGIPETPSLQHKYGKYNWSRMSKKERLIAHLSIIADSLGGKLESFEIFDD